jgi:hypothetical protein
MRRTEFETKGTGNGDVTAMIAGLAVALFAALWFRDTPR